MNFQNKTEFLNSLVKKEDEVKKALTKLYQGVRATNKFLGLENSPELQDTYYKLRCEEVGELFTAIENGDKVEFLDAVVDGLVVVGYEFSLKGEQKLEPNPEDNIEFSMEHPTEIIDRLKYYYDKEDEEGPTLGWLEELFNQLDIDHMKAVDEVLSSNMSKFPTRGELCRTVRNYTDWHAGHYYDEFQCKKIEEQGRYVDVFHEIRYDESIQDDRVIFWAKGEKQKDGSIKEFKAPKYVKPRTFKEPDFAKCWLN